MSLPRMRTAPEAIREIKELDPNSAFTLRALHPRGTCADNNPLGGNFGH